MSEAKKGIILSEDTKLKMSISQGTSIYVYCSDKSTLLYIFTSQDPKDLERLSQATFPGSKGPRKAGEF